MQRNITKFVAVMLSVALFLFGCGKHNENVEDDNDSRWRECKQIYTTVVQNSGEDDSTEKYLEIAERSNRLFQLLEKNVGVFVMDAQNYQDVDGEGTPCYEMNGQKYPVEINPYGQSIRVSKNYFKFNPIQTLDGSNLIEQIIYDDLTLNVLVPEKYKQMEEQIIEAYRADFYFQKVTAANDYNEMAGIKARADISEEELKVHIIYVKDGQRYFTFRQDCAVKLDNWITDPVVQIYTSNVHCNYAHSFMSQWVYFYSDSDSEEGAFEDIQPYVKQCGAESSFQKVYAIS